MCRLLPLLLCLPLVAASTPEWPDLSTPPVGTAKDATGDVALILAVESYTALPHVDGAVANARAWQAYLKARGVGTVKLMLDGEVTKETILGGEGLVGAAQQVLAQRKRDGKVWVVFIGHGAPGDGAGALVGWDAQRTAASITTRSIGQDALLHALGRDDGVPIVAVLDACFSGRTAAGELAPGVQPVVPVDAERAVTVDTTVLVAAGEKEFAGSMPGLGRPAFSWLALGALRGWGDEDGDGTVTAQEVVDWAGGRLVETVNDRSQTPGVFGQTERTLGRGRERAPDLTLYVGRAISDAGSAAKTAVAVPSTATSSGSFSSLDLDVSAQLQEQGCAEEAKAAGAAERAKKLEAAAAMASSEAKTTWARLEPGATSCLKVADAAMRERCAATLDAFVTQASTLTVRLPAGTEPVTTACGARSVAFAEETRAVSVAEVAAAKSLAAKLRVAPTAARSVSAADASGQDWRSSTVGLMKWIPAGTFVMGSPTTEAGRDTDETQHQVTLTRGFLLMEHEVTQGEWEAVMGSNPSKFTACGPTCPVDFVSWLDAVTFANAVSKNEGLSPAYVIDGDSVECSASATGYRLPTEAEWEYAARGGQADGYAGSEDLGVVAWVGTNSGSTTHPSCGKRRNGYGLCDMSGNVWEWVWDRYGEYGTSAVRDPTGPAAGYLRVFRGGGWGDSSMVARVAIRDWTTPDGRGGRVGLRLALSVP